MQRNNDLHEQEARMCGDNTDEDAIIERTMRHQSMPNLVKIRIGRHLRRFYL